MAYNIRSLCKNLLKVHLCHDGSLQQVPLSSQADCLCRIKRQICKQIILICISSTIRHSARNRETEAVCMRRRLRQRKRGKYVISVSETGTIMPARRTGQSAPAAREPGIITVVAVQFAAHADNKILPHFLPIMSRVISAWIMKGRIVLVEKMEVSILLFLPVNISINQQFHMIQIYTYCR